MSILSTVLSSDIYIPPYETYEDRKIKELQRRTKELEEQLYAAVSRNKKTEVELPERYIINDGATILFWKDGSKTVVKRAQDDEFNPRLAFLTAFFQHYCGMSKNKANKYLASLEVEKKPEIEKDVFIKIKDVECTYSTYRDFINFFFPQFKKNWKLGEVPDKRKKYKLIGSNIHKWNGRICSLIQDPKTKQVYIIGKEGIEEEK